MTLPTEVLVSAAEELIRLHAVRVGSVVIDVGRADEAMATRLQALGLDYLAVVDHQQAGTRLGLSAVAVADLGDPGAVLSAIEGKLGDRPVAAIFLLGTLEQVPSPVELLGQLRVFAQHGAHTLLVVAVANVTHVDLAVELLTGRLEGGWRPLLEQGRLRYFSEGYLAATMTASGWEQIDSHDVRSAPAPDEITDPDGILSPGTPIGDIVRGVRRQADGGADTTHFVRAYRPSSSERLPEAAPSTQAPPFLTVLLRTQGRRPATFPEALLSLAAQTSPDFEVLVLAHDVSDDLVSQIEAQVAEFHDTFARRVRVVPVHGGGRSRPLNVGASLARGRYLAMLDDDDLAFANWVSVFASAAAQGPGRVLRLNVATQLVVGRPGAWSGSDGYDVTDRPHCDYPSRFDLLDHLLDNRTPNNGYAVPRSLATELHLGWDENLPVLEDWDHLLRTASLAGAVSSPEVGALLRAWMSGATSKTAHDDEVWERTRQRVLDERDAHPLLTDRGTASRIREVLTSELEARSEVDRLESWLQATKESLETSANTLDHTLRALEATERRLEEVLASTSWRLMAGVRRLSGAVRGMARPKRDVHVPEATTTAPRMVPVLADRRLYERWVEVFDSLDRAERWHLEQSLGRLERFPLISVVVPVYNPPPQYLREAVESVRAQIYGRWELCIADDCSTDPKVAEVLVEAAADDDRIKVVRRAENGHISAATNSALDIALGEWVAFMDHDDLLAPHALAVMALSLSAHPGAVLAYSDEDKVDDSGHRFDPYFKPDFDPLLLLGQNYMTHLFVARRDFVQRVGGTRLGFEGAQDWDLALRLCEQVDKSRIVHVPHVLYHWRAHEASTAEALAAKPYATNAGRLAVEQHLERRQLSATVTTIAESGHNRIEWNVPDPAPKVSVIIPTRDGRYLEQCVKSLLGMTEYPNFEVLVVDNGSENPAILDFLASREDARFRVRRDARPFNYSALNNAAVTDVDGELVCLLNDDTEIVNPSWLSEMVGNISHDGVGVVGAKLYYGDGRIQHAGVILGIGGVAGHPYRRWAHDSLGYMGRLLLAQSMSAVTGACMLVRRLAWLQVGGLDETRLAVAFNDVDLCLKILQAGWRVVWTPWAELMHYESVSRGPETSRIDAFAAEIRCMQERWGLELERDAAYNPNLTLIDEDWSLAWPPRRSYTASTLT